MNKQPPNDGSAPHHGKQSAYRREGVVAVWLTLLCDSARHDHERMLLF
jgi:hypothetical protein